MGVQPGEAADGALVIVTTTVADEADAERLSALLVERRLAACVQRSAMRSTYRWEGCLEDAREWRLDAKTAPERAEACAVALAEAHPYDVPEVVTLRAEASKGYAAWVRAETVEG